MPCERFDATLADGTPVVGIACTRGPSCSECSRPGRYLCDWKLKGAKAGKTCDRRLCATCATHVAPDKHLCRPHAARWAVHPKNPNRTEMA